MGAAGPGLESRLAAAPVVAEPREAVPAAVLPLPAAVLWVVEPVDALVKAARVAGVARRAEPVADREPAPPPTVSVERVVPREAVTLVAAPSEEAVPSVEAAPFAEEAAAGAQLGPGAARAHFGPVALVVPPAAETVPSAPAEPAVAERRPQGVRPAVAVPGVPVVEALGPVGPGIAPTAAALTTEGTAAVKPPEAESCAAEDANRRPHLQPEPQACPREGP